MAERTKFTDAQRASRELPEIDCYSSTQLREPQDALEARYFDQLGLIPLKSRLGHPASSEIYDSYFTALERYQESRRSKIRNIARAIKPLFWPIITRS